MMATSIPQIDESQICQGCRNVLQAVLATAQSTKLGMAHGKTSIVADASHVVQELQGLSVKKEPLPCKMCEFLRRTLAPDSPFANGQANWLEVFGHPVKTLLSSHSIREDDPALSAALVQNVVRSWLFRLGHRYVRSRFRPDAYYFGISGPEGSTYGRKSLQHFARIAADQSIDASLLGDSKESEPTPPSSSKAGVVPIPTFIDFAVLRSWITNCPPECRAPRSWSNAEWNLVSLIDCETRRVEKAPKGSRFIALSYVWGQPTEKNPRPIKYPIPFQLPDRCTPTIEDSIQATRKLGYRYLWVDALCISAEKDLMMKQISRMDLIYSRADLTIIALAGNDASHGLPGVSTPRTAANQSIQALEVTQGSSYYTLASALAPLESVISDSVHTTRGWTYQEDFLSTHQLVFADDVVYFTCPFGSLQESVDIPSEVEVLLRRQGPLSPSEGSQQLANPEWFYKGPDFIIHPKKKGKLAGSSFLDVFRHHVEEYTRRNLSFDGDSLHAFQAVLARFYSHGLLHLCGVPLEENIDAGNDPKCTIPASTNEAHDKTSSRDFGSGLTWIHMDYAIKRRSHLPSWTWAGWEGTVSWEGGCKPLTPEKRPGFFVLDKTQRGALKHSESSVEAKDWATRREQANEPEYLIVKTSTWVQVKLESERPAKSMRWTFRIHNVEKDGSEEDTLFASISTPEREQAILSQRSLAAFQVAENRESTIWLIIWETDRQGADGRRIWERVGLGRGRTPQFLTTNLARQEFLLG